MLRVGLHFSVTINDGVMVSTTFNADIFIKATLLRFYKTGTDTLVRISQ